MVIRRTKIVCTLGPATDKPAILERLILAGCNVVRMNFSHGSAEDHQRRAKQVRQIAQSHGRSVAILGDLQGPKIRIAQFKNGPITLAVNDRFILDSELTSSEGDKQQVGIDYKELPNEVSEGDLLLLDDGRIVLQVNAVTGSRIETRVQVAGILSNNKGINREGGGLSAAALTPKDLADIQLAAAIDVDYLAVSFVRSNADVHLARKLLLEAGGNANIVAKIERAEAVNDNATMDGIIEASDAIMVARGDLGVEIGDAELMAVQKHLIERARTLNKAVITATQMMESMIVSPIPTRAEVFDVANAVLDGTDAVMLSAETAAGNYPVESVEAVHRVILGAESHRQSHISAHRLHENFEQTDESIAMATMYTANHMKGVKAVVSLTETGKTTLLMSRIRSHLPLFSFTRHQKVANKMALYRGVTAGVLDISKLKADKVNQFAFESLMTHQVASSGDTVVIAKGDHNKMEEGTNTMLIQKIKKTG